MLICIYPSFRFTFSSEDVDPLFLRGALVSHGCGLLLLLLAGALRSLNAPPMLLLVDQLPPLLGARSTMGTKGFRPFQRCKERPPVMSCQKWHQERARGALEILIEVLDVCSDMCVNVCVSFIILFFHMLCVCIL